MTNSTVPSVRVMRPNTEAPTGSHLDSPITTLADLEKLIRGADEGSTLAGRVVLNGDGKEFAIQLYIRDPQRNLVKKLWDFARGRDIDRRGNAQRAVERLLTAFEAQPGASESVRQIRTAINGKRHVKVTDGLQKAVGRLAAGNEATDACIKDFVSLTPKDSRALKAKLGSLNPSTNRTESLNALTLTAMQHYASNRLAVKSHTKVTLNPKRLEALDLKSERAKLDPLKRKELDQVAQFAKKWLDAYREDPSLVPSNPDPKDSARQLPTWQSEVHDIVLAFAKAHPDLMDEVIGARHTPDFLKSAEFRECALLLGLPLPKSELKNRLPQRLDNLGSALQKEICGNPETRLLFETSDPKAFKRYLFREFIAKTGDPLNEGGKRQVAAPLSITFLQFCRRTGAAADYLYLDVLSKMPDRLELDYAAEKARLLELMDAGKRAPKEKRVKDDVRRIDVHASGFTLGKVKYTRVQEADGLHPFAIFKDKKGNRVAARSILKTIGAKPNPEYEKQLAALRSGARIHSQISDSSDDIAINSLATIPGPNGELLHVVESTDFALGDVAIDDPTPGQRRKNRFNDIRLAFIDAVEAVAHVHEKNLIHLGLSENNFRGVLRNGEIRYMLTDFDAAARGKEHQIFEPRAASFDYAAPEMVWLQYRNENTSSHRLPDLLATQMADMWALGVMLFKMHVGYAPFKDLTGRELKKSDLSPYDNIRFTRAEEKAMPEDVRKLVKALLNRDPAKRPTVDDLLDLPYFDRKKTIPAAALSGGAALQQRKISEPNKDVATNATTPGRTPSAKSFDQPFQDSHVRDDESNTEISSVHISGASHRDSDSSVSEGSDDPVAKNTDTDVAMSGEPLKPGGLLQEFMDSSDPAIGLFVSETGIDARLVRAMIQYLKFFSKQGTDMPKATDVAQFAGSFVAYLNTPNRLNSLTYAAILVQVNAFLKANPQQHDDTRAKSDPAQPKSTTLPFRDEGSEVEGTDAEESSTAESSLSEGTAYGTTRITPDSDELDGGTTRLLSPATGGAPGGDFAAAVSGALGHVDEFNDLEPGLGKQPRKITRIQTNVFTPPTPRTTTAATTTAATTTATTAAITTATRATTTTRATTASVKTAAKDIHNLKRFVDAQKGVIDTALKELKSGQKKTHWMWFVFPQIAGLISNPSDNSKRYAIASLDEAKAYLADPVLNSRLRECCSNMLYAKGNSALAILGSPDEQKFHACLTLFSRAAEDNGIFHACLLKYFGGRHHPGTDAILGY